MKSIDESWRFLEDFFKSDPTISQNINRILSLTTDYPVCEDNFNVFFEDIMKLTHLSKDYLTYLDFLCYVTREREKNIDYLETALLNVVWSQITKNKQINKENINDNLSKAYLILKSMGITLDWALYGGKSEYCFDHKSINYLQQGWSNFVNSNWKDYIYKLISRILDDELLEELYPLTIFFIFLRNEYEYSLKGQYLKQKIESLEVFYKQDWSKIYSSVINGLYNRYEQKDPEIIEWCKSIDSVEIHPLIAKNIIDKNKRNNLYALYDALFLKLNQENGDIKKKKYEDTEKYIADKQKRRLLLDYAFPYNQIQMNDKFIDKAKRGIELLRKGGNETIQEKIENDENFLVNILNQMYLSFMMGNEYKKYYYDPENNGKEFFDYIQIDATKNKNKKYDDNRVLIYRNSLTESGCFLFIKSEEERIVQSSVSEAFRHFQHANKDFMTSNTIHELSKDLTSLKEFILKFYDFVENLNIPIKNEDKDNVLYFLGEYINYLSNKENSLVDNRIEIKTSIKLLKNIEYKIRYEDFDKIELEDCLNRVYRNLQKNSIQKMDKLLNLCDIITEKEEQIKSNLNILCSVEDKGNETTIILKDFLNKYINLKSKEIKWAKITWEMTLIDESCCFTHNETILKNILNSIIENAHRHGFEGYECTSPTIHFNVIEEDNRIIMKICNNGKPINTTTEEYRTNGVFNGATGHTGIGGYQISRWANKYGGDVMVSKSDKWDTEIHLIIRK